MPGNKTPEEPPAEPLVLDAQTNALITALIESGVKSALDKREIMPPSTGDGGDAAVDPNPTTPNARSVGGRAGQRGKRVRTEKVPWTPKT